MTRSDEQHETPRRAWTAPTLEALPELKELTLDSGTPFEPPRTEGTAVTGTGSTSTGTISF